MNHLMRNDAKDITRLLAELFMFAYTQKHDIDKEVIDIPSVLSEGSAILFENEITSTIYINQYLSQNHISNFNRKIIKQWCGAKKHELYMMDENHDFAIMYDKEEATVYGVKGLTDALSFTLREQTLPVKVYYAILPYHNFYIVDAIGLTSAIIEIDEIIELYEGYRSASYHKPVKLSDTETTEIIHLARTMDDNINDVFMDFARPMLYIVQTLPNMLKDVMQILLYAWNDAAEDCDLYQNKELYEFIQPMIKRRKETFGQYQQIIQTCNIYIDEDGVLQCDVTLEKGT